ncbi:MAG: hypothetical protein EB078_09235 [Proteobacteria bacterium]|nr:hypothetical protein [Pseudomonadota bacterium]NDC23352.1 hypothetical protein [Pseudomonadota bacterium]NDD05078.1 hypothetical protein [Pseudomonadota bacterium]NDG28405.1 hypothetical protein [Pseudomonadota bacterium]
MTGKLGYQLFFCSLTVAAIVFAEDHQTGSEVRRRFIRRWGGTQESEITVSWVLNRLKQLSLNPQLEPHETFESLKQQAEFLKKELSEVVVERAKLDHIPEPERSTAVARALETERENIREKLKRVQSQIKDQIKSIMEKEGFISLGPGSTHYEKGNKRISVRFDSGEILIRAIE